jgi:chitinase
MVSGDAEHLGERLASSTSPSRASTFTVTLDKPSTSQVTVKYATADGNATAGSDYSAQAAQTLVFAPGEVSKSVYVDLRDDAVSESAEFFDLTLSGAVNAVIADPRGHMVIAKATAPTGRDAGDLRVVHRGDGRFDLAGIRCRAERAVDADGERLVQQQQRHALNGSDYVALSGSIVFQPGEVIHTSEDSADRQPRRRADRDLRAQSLQPGQRDRGHVFGDRHHPRQRRTARRGQLAQHRDGQRRRAGGQPGSNAVSGGAGNDVLDGRTASP